MKKIHLTKEQITIVDDEDYNYLNQYKWLYTSLGYAARAVSIEGRKQKFIYMHKVIMGALNNSSPVDHINRDKLDNRKENLRICTNSQNQMNRGISINNTSGYKGVSPYRGGWRALIYKDTKPIYLGQFNDIIDAAKAYNEAASRIFGEFAYINNIERG